MSDAISLDADCRVAQRCAARRLAMSAHSAKIKWVRPGSRMLPASGAWPAQTLIPPLTHESSDTYSPAMICHSISSLGTSPSEMRRSWPR